MTIANTQSLSTNFNVDPYYDDYNEDKNFHRILYRPGLAVQGRELTQMQTILQNQVDRFAEHIFDEGSTVRGLEMNYDSAIAYVKIRDGSANGATVNTAALVGSAITGGTSGMTAIVYDYLTGSEAATPDTKTLYLKYTNSGSNNTTKKFVSGEVLTSNTGLAANVITGAADTVANYGSRITLGDGILYAKDHFIRSSSQSLVVGRYSSNVSYKIGIDIEESVVSSTTDTTLLDPARGAYNYAAPGADRLKLTPTLVKKELTDTSTSNFIEKVRIKNGVMEFKGDKPFYSVINDYIARRTEDESGDYIVRGLDLRLREHLNSANNQGVYTLADGGDSTKLSADILPGKAYIKGYETERIVTSHVEIDKGVDYESVESLSISANYGNYTIVDNVVGTWDVNSHDRVDLYDTKQNAIANGTFSSSGPVGTKIGEARVRALEYSSGTKGDAEGRYSIYLYDINMSANSFNYVRGIHYNDSTYDGFADTILTGGNAVLNETAFNRTLFQIPAENIKTLRDTTDSIDNTYRFLKEFDSLSIATNGTVTATTASSDEQFPFSTGLINDTQERENFYVVMRGTANSASALETTAAKTAGSNTVTGLTSATTKYNVGDVIQLQGIANNLVISSVDSASQVKLYGTTVGGSASGATLFKKFVPGQVISLNGYGGDGAARSVNINSTTSATIDIQETLSTTVDTSVYCELNKVDGQEIAKVINKNRYVEINVSDSGTTSGPWNLGLSDGHKLREVRVKTGNSFFTTTSEGSAITDQFEIDTGMRDNFYDHSKLKLKASATHSIANGNVYLVKFDYFTHDTSSGIGYFSVDSYPIDDANTANTTAITTGEIPLYTSPITGARYDLRNFIDIRPRITDTANSVTTLSNISRNPATSTIIVEPSGGLRFMAPNENFTTDLDYYLPRKDRIVIVSRGGVTSIKGVPSLNPQTPAAPSDGLTLAVVDVSPYPSLPYENAKRINRTDLACKVTPVKQMRYTMRDIGSLKNRIENLEYYTSLSLLEADTKSTFLADSSGNDRFKNGILVDAFTGHNIGNVFNPDYKISVDTTANELRPSFKLNDAQLEYKSANSSNVTSKSKDVTLVVGSGTFSNGETITSGAASGTLVYQVANTLYLEDVSGSFSVSTTATGSTSTTAATISSVTVASDGKLITLPYTHDMVIEQPNATDTRNTVGLFWSFQGNLILSPETDYWVDTVIRPEVQIDFDFNTQAWQNLANAWGTQFGNWNTVWTGAPNITQRRRAGGQEITTTTTSTQDRQGLRAEIGVPQTQTVSLGESVRDVNIIPFIRSRVINFTAQGLKPSTRVYAFFDDEDVNSYCSLANSSFANTASEGSALTTDSNGVLYGLFRIPNEEAMRFRTSTLVFKLTDSPTNTPGIGSTTTYAQAQYTASGLNQVVQDTVVSTRNVNLEFVTVDETRNITDTSSRVEVIDRGDRGGDRGGGRQGSRDGGDRGGSDPIAQTFLVDTRDNTGNGSSPGGFLTKIDLYFQSKDSTDPIVVEIREVDASTSYITNKVVPFGKKVLNPSDINISNDSSAPTPVIFDTPVYLLNNTEYAFAVKPVASNPNYTIWTARLGNDDIITGNRIVSQPYSGMLFASANDRAWSPIQEEDIKFKMYFANFGTNQTGTAVFKNIDKEYLTIANTDSTTIFDRVNELVHGETTLNLSGAISANVGDIIVQANTTSAQSNGIVTYNSGSTIRVKEVITTTKFTDSATIYKYAAGSAANTGVSATISSQSTPTGRVYFFDPTTQANTTLHLSSPSGTFVANTWIRGQVSGLDARISLIDSLKVDTFHTLLGKLELQSTTSAITGKFATSTSARDSAFRNINDNGDTEYNARRFILSKTDETNNLSGEKSAEIKVTLTNTENKRHSPAIDNDRSAVFTVENIINNDETNEDAASGGNSLARYITRTVTLAEGQDAEDLKIYISAYKPSTATISTYYKILNGEDGETLEDQSWAQMTQVTLATVNSDSENTQDFREFEYTIPTANLTGGSGEVQYTNTSGVTYTGFKRFAIKVVLLSSTPSRVPRVKDFRAIAIQI